MNDLKNIDSKTRIAAVIVAIVSMAFTVFTWFNSEAKLSLKNNDIRNLGIELLINNRKINKLEDSLLSLKNQYNNLVILKDSIKQQSDSVEIVSHQYFLKIQNLYDEIDSIAIAPIDAPDSVQLRIFLYWTSKQ